MKIVPFAIDIDENIMAVKIDANIRYGETIVVLES